MSEIEKAIRQICDEKNISYEVVISAIEVALAAAYRKDFGEKDQNIKVEFDASTGVSMVYDEKTVVTDEMYNDVLALVEEKSRLRAEGRLEKQELTEEEKQREKEIATYPKMHLPFSEAKKIKKDVELGEILRIKLVVPEAYGRMAAQTAKQVITQRLRETEREMVFDEFKSQEGKILVGTVQRKDGRAVFVDIGKITGLMLAEDQISRESYRPGERVRVYIKSVEQGSRGIEVLISRTHPNIVKELFVSEIPEISSGVVNILSVAREAGSRAKVAVKTNDDSIDPIGSCIGQRGVRIQTIINELGGEKIDIILYDEDPKKYISNALAPAKVLSLDINEEEKDAIAYVSPDQFSLAIGKSGQNVRLAAKLTGWKINVKEERSDNVSPAEVSVDAEGEKVEGPKEEVEVSAEEVETKE